MTPARRWGLAAAIALLAFLPAVPILLVPEIRELGVAPLMPLSVLFSVVIMFALRHMTRRHGEAEVRLAASRAGSVVGTIALIGVLILIFGLPLFFLWLGGS